MRPAFVIVAAAGLSLIASQIPVRSEAGGDADLLVRPSLSVMASATVTPRRIPTSRQHVAVLVDKHAVIAGVPREAFHRLVKRESGYNPRAVGPVTPYGRAYGPTQILCSTARGLGEPDCGRLIRDPDRAIQLGAAYFRQGFDATGSWHGAAAYYHGGPNRAIHGRKTAAYAAAVSGSYATTRIAYNVAPMAAAFDRSTGGGS